jgi:hypothetical protein
MKTSKIKPAHWLGPLLCLLPLGFSVLQDPKPDTERETPAEEDVFSDSDFFGTKQGTIKGATLTRGMQGCWKLASIKAEDYPDQGIDLLGYLLISGSFMALEVQAFWDDTLEDPPEDAFETFIGEVSQSEKDTMEVRILMGSFMDRDEGSLEWYQSDRPERFAISQPDADTLFLEWRGQRQMMFLRQRSQAQTALDFFGASEAIDNFYDQTDDPIEDDMPPREEGDEDDEFPDDDPFE